MRDYRKKGKIGLMYRTSSWSELLSTLIDSLALPSSVVTRDSPNEFGALHSLLRPFTITKVLCISTENVQGWGYVVEIEEKWQTKLYACSQNVPNNKSILVVFLLKSALKVEFLLWKTKKNHKTLLTLNSYEYLCKVIATWSRTANCSLKLMNLLFR